MQEPTLLTGATLGTEDRGDIVIRSARGDLLYRFVPIASLSQQPLEEVLSVCRHNALAFAYPNGRAPQPAPTTQDIIISPSVCGMQLRRSVIEQLLTLHPELFDEPHPLKDLEVPGVSAPDPEEDKELFANSVVQGELVYFLDMGAKLRTCRWLIEKLQRDGNASLVPPGSRTELKIVSIPSDVKWYIRVDDDGSEMVFEQSRSWQ
jgi:hypothetical protein